MRSGVLILSGVNVSTPTWQDALRAVTYWSSSEDPTGTQSAGDRIVTFMVSDGDASSASVARVVTVTPANDAPGLGGVENWTLAYTENGNAAVVSATITVSDSDLVTDASLDGATVTISSGFHVGDVLALRATATAAYGVMGLFNASSGILIISGANVSVSTLAWQDALRAVTFSSSSLEGRFWSAGNRIVTFMVSDGDASSASVSRVVTVTPAHDAPRLGGVENWTLAYTENDAPVAVSSTIAVSASGVFMVRATVNISGGFHVGDVLGYNGSAAPGVTGAYSAHASSGVLILSGVNVSTPTWQDALRAVTYWSSSEDPTGTQLAGDRIVTFMVSDGDVSSGGITCGDIFIADNHYHFANYVANHGNCTCYVAMSTWEASACRE
jgi:hypothetical protein